VRKSLVRAARRLASWESSTDDELLETEFRTRTSGLADLRPSVYEVGATEVVRALAEHDATNCDPKNKGGGVDLGGLGYEVLTTIGKTIFSFTKATHREIVLKDRQDLLSLVKAVRDSLSSRRIPVTRDQIIRFAKEQIAEGNKEWIAAKQDPSAKKWLSEL
jgi:hypothetical protein